jgi:hypothetical protein
MGVSCLHAGVFGTVVRIRGDNLLGGGAEIVSVKLNTVEVAQILVNNSDNEIVVVAAEGSPGAGDVVLVADTGAVISTACV